MTIVEKLGVLYDKDPLDYSTGECSYCHARLGPGDKHDRLCVWQVSLQAADIIESQRHALDRREAVIHAQANNIVHIGQQGAKPLRELVKAQEKVGRLTVESDKLRVLARDRFPGYPFNHCGECLFCDELAQHSEDCPVRNR